MKTSLIVLILCGFSILGKAQTDSEIIQLDDKNAYRYISYHDNGEIKEDIGFYSKKPFSTISESEQKLKKYKIKRHGESKEFYSNGQLKETVTYRKGKVIVYAKSYFEDGEEYSVANIEQPSFQFTLEERPLWFGNEIRKIENRINRDLHGYGWIVLEISKSGEIKQIKVAKSSDEKNNDYLVEIGHQITVVKPALKDGLPIGTRYAFQLEL